MVANQVYLKLLNQYRSCTVDTSQKNYAIVAKYRGGIGYRDYARLNIDYKKREQFPSICLNVFIKFELFPN